MALAAASLVAWTGTGLAEEAGALAKSVPPVWAQAARGIGADVSPTPDDRSFYLVWLPEGAVTFRPPVIVALHDRGETAVDVVEAWRPYAAERGYGLVAVQWTAGPGASDEAVYSSENLAMVLWPILRGYDVIPGTALLYGRGAGAAHAYLLAALDRQTADPLFKLVVADAGGIRPESPVYQDISSGRYGQIILAGTRWVLFCGGRDPAPERDGCPAMRRTRDWLQTYGGRIDRLIEDPASGHDGFRRSPAHVNTVLDLFDRLMAGSPES